MSTFNDRLSRFTQMKEEDEIRRRGTRQLENAVETKRSMLDRGLDLLSVGQYVSAGIAKGIVDEDSTVIGNVLGGLAAGNPFGKGYEEGEHSFTDVLEESGWKPESTLGKVAKGTVGFLGDVFLDPTTYMTLGIGAALKGGKGALQTAKVADKIIDIDKAKDVVKRFLANSGEELSEDAIEQQAKKLLEQHNKLLGVNKTPRGIELSLANAPFGEKLFGNLSQARKTLATGEQVAEFGDKFIAPTYQKLRSDLMKTKFADLFSKNSRLYKMALDNPDELYTFMRSEVMQKRQAGALIKDKRKIMATAAKLREMDFTPEEVKQITDLLQDPNTRKIIYQDNIKEEMESINFLRSKLDTISNDFKNYVSGSVAEMEEIDKLINSDKGTIDNILRAISDTDEEYRQLTDMFDVEKAELNEMLEMRRQEMLEDIKSVPTPVLSVSGELPKVNKVLTKEYDRTLNVPLDSTKALDSDLEDIASVYNLDFPGASKQMIGRIKKQVADKGYYAFTDKKRADAFMKKTRGWRMVNVDGEFRVVPPKSLKIGDVVIDSITKENSAEFAEMLNRQYGLRINPLAANQGVLKEMYKAIQDGWGKGKIEYIYNKNIKALNGYDKKVHQYLARRLKYGSYSADVTDKIEKLKYLQHKGELSKADELELNDLVKKASTKNKLENEIRTKYKTLDELDQFLASESNYRVQTEMFKNEKVALTGEELYDDAMEKKRQGFADDLRKVNKYGEEIKKTEYSPSGAGMRMPRYTPTLDSDEMEFISVDVIDLLFPKANRKDPKVLARINQVIKEVPNVIKDKHKWKFEQNGSKKILVPYMDELSADARLGIYKQALRNINPKLKKTDDIAELFEEAKRKGAVSEILKQDIESVVELTTKLDGVLGKPAEYSEAFAEEIGKFDDVADKLADKTADLERLQSRIDDLELRRKTLNDLHADLATKHKGYEDLLNIKQSGIDSEYQKLVDARNGIEQAIKERENMISLHERFLDSVGISPDNYENISTLYKLDAMDYPDKIKNAVHFLRNEFLRIGKEEVEIGKLKQGAFETWANNYVPHILTEDGLEFIKQNGDKVAKALPGFDSKKIGYGRTFNPFVKERTLKNIRLDGQFISNPTIDQLNRYFQQEFPELKDSKIFIDDITDLYVQRALKHVDVMYDHKYMNEMLGMFGTKYDGTIKPGQKLVMNFGVLRDKVLVDAKKRFGQTWDSYAADNDIVRTLSDIYGNGTPEYKAAFSRAQSQYMEQVTGDILESGYNLPRAALTDLSTPMIEVTEDQAKYMANAFGDSHEVYSVNDLIVDKANQSRKYQIQKYNNQLLNIFDKFTHFIKLNQTTVMPGFHVRNKIGNMFNSYLAIGQDAINPKFQKVAHDVLMKKGDVDDILIITKPDGTQVEKSWREIYEAAQQYGILDEGFFEKDLGTTSAIAANPLGLPKKLNPLDTKNFTPYVVGAKVGTHVEGMDKLIHFASQISRGMDYQEAYDSVSKYLFNYGDLTLFEQSVMKRIFPYYTWLRKNAPLQLETMLEKPELYRNVNKVLRGVSNMNNEEDRMEDRYTADFAQDWVQMPFKSKEGNPIIANPSLPMGDINRIPDITNPKDSVFEILAQMNPLLKVPAEFATNTNFFLDKEIFEEGENPMSTKLDYILSQGAYYNTGKNIINDEGTDKALRILNALAGIKFSEYEYEKYKGIMQNGGWK